MSAANEIVYASPSFDARSRIPVANAGVYENQECRLDSPVFVEVLEEGEMLTPLVTDLENIGTRPEDIDASALLTGTVESSATLRNGLTGGSFVHGQVATYGMTLDCLFSTDDVPDGLSPRNVVQGTFWLIGRLLPSA